MDQADIDKSIADNDRKKKDLEHQDLKDKHNKLNDDHDNAKNKNNDHERQHAEKDQLLENLNDQLALIEDQNNKLKNDLD